MTLVSEILKPHHVDLDFAASDGKSAVLRLTERLRGDPRISAWNELTRRLQHNAGEGLTTLSSRAALCHARTEGITSMLMAAGRQSSHEAGFRYVFVIGLPPAMAAEYLRVVGALARTLKDPAAIDALDKAEDTDAFIAILSRGDRAL